MSQTKHHGRTVNVTPVPDGCSVTELVGLIDTGGETRAAAFAALCDKGDSEALHAILGYALSGDWRLRRLAAEHLGHGDNQTALSRLRDLAAEDESPYVVRTAIEQLGLLGDLRSRKLALTLALSGSQKTQLTALRTLERLGTSDDFAAVFALFESTPTEAVRRRAGWVLRAITDSETWETLFVAFASDPLHRHRQWACELAAEHGSSETLESLAALQLDLDGHVRKAAAAAEAKITSRLPDTTH